MKIKTYELLIKFEINYILNSNYAPNYDQVFSNYRVVTCYKNTNI